MNREQAWELVQQRVSNRNLRNHMLAAEMIMRKLAEHFGEDEEKWGLAGLLHDLDYDETADDPQRHSLVAAAELEKLGVDPEVVYAVKVHNHVHGLPRVSRMDRALYVSDPLTGLIVAAALILPAKKLAAVTTEFVLNRFKEKGFARGANREQIMRCEPELGLSLAEFVTIGLSAMQQGAASIGL
ncbi:MAG: HDIG domain-containing protein [Firmicutes bacterium]|nr:HDIG domain-containing protein [Bacillota bacterium]